jgi:hypothetical protein
LSSDLFRLIADSWYTTSVILSFKFGGKKAHLFQITQSALSKKSHWGSFPERAVVGVLEGVCFTAGGGDLQMHWRGRQGWLESHKLELPIITVDVGRGGDRVAGGVPRDALLNVQAGAGVAHQAVPAVVPVDRRQGPL